MVCILGSLADAGQVSSVLTSDIARHKLSPTEKAAYIQADLCLMNSPAKAFVDVEGVETRWDDLQWLHISLANVIHEVVRCLPP